MATPVLSTSSYKKDELVTQMANETPNIVEAWWERHKCSITAWRAAGAFEDRSLHFVLLGNVSSLIPSKQVRTVPLFAEM